MKLGIMQKQPGEKRRWGIQYEDALDEGDALLLVSAAVDDADLTVSAVIESTTVRFTVSGGVDGVTYKITFTVTTTSAHEIFEDEVYIKVKEI